MMSLTEVLTGSFDLFVDPFRILFSIDQGKENNCLMHSSVRANTMITVRVAVFILATTAWSSTVVAKNATAANDQHCFPSNFLVGTATAAYQVEGGWNLTGREPSIWDVYCRENENVECANVADDMLHRFPSDIQLMADMGLTSFRFSISWSRVMHWNDKQQQLERTPEGIQFYHRVIQNLHQHGIEPLLTMYHWDLPQALQDHLDPPGWLNTNISAHFVAFARLLVRNMIKMSCHYVLRWPTVLKIANS